jgi:hypothetical protein
MAVAPQAAGTVLVKIDANQGSGLESLGYTINGVDIQEEHRHTEVPGDQNGGEEGHPIEEQWLSSVHIVRLELSSYERLVGEKLHAHLAGATAGTTPTPGTFILGASKYFRLLLLSTNTDFIRNYTRAILAGEPKEINHGTKWRKFVATFKCYPTTPGGAGTLYNTTSS